MERKNLLKSQKELLRMKRECINIAVEEFNQTLSNIALELGIPEEEMKSWSLSRNDEYIEKVEIRNKISDIKGQGYQPEKGNLDPENPPKGGSGIPKK